MQNPDTGHMEPISAEKYAELEQMQKREIADGRRPSTCIMRRGEIVELNGGRFRVAAIGTRFVRLEGLPGTRVGEE